MSYLPCSIVLRYRYGRLSGISVNAHAEELRSHFVEHEGKKELVVTAAGTRYTVDFGNLAKQMTGKIHENVGLRSNSKRKSYSAFVLRSSIRI